MVFQKLSVHENNTLASNKGKTGAASNTLITPIQIPFNLGVILPKPKNVAQVIEIKEFISLFWH